MAKVNRQLLFTKSQNMKARKHPFPTQVPSQSPVPWMLCSSGLFYLLQLNRTGPTLSCHRPKEVKPLFPSLPPSCTCQDGGRGEGKPLWLGISASYSLGDELGLAQPFPLASCPPLWEAGVGNTCPWPRTAPPPVGSAWNGEEKDPKVETFHFPADWQARLGLPHPCCPPCSLHLREGGGLGLSTLWHADLG